MAADLLITGARVRPVDGSAPGVRSLAVRRGRIAALGEEAEELRARTTEVLHLPGRLVVPGFQDAHVHPPDSGLERLRCDLTEAEDREACRRAVSGYARAHPEAEWILGGGWPLTAFPGGTPSRAELDDLVPDRPAFLHNRDGHGAWVNGRALELAGITAGTPDPPDGRIERDPATGEPAGTLHEGAMGLVERIVPSPLPDEWRRAILEAQAYLHSLGITAWQDARVTAETLEAYRWLAERGELTARVVAALWWDRGRGPEQVDDLEALRARGRVGRLRADTVKVMLDGVAENFTASMLEPYLGSDGRPTANRGISFIEPGALPDHVARLDGQGFQVHFHAIGDGAVRQALDAVEHARRANGPRDARHHVAHLQVVHPADVPRFAALDVVATAQPLWACHEPQMDELTIPFLGPVRTGWQYPLASLARAGTRLAFGSDWSVTTADPLLQMEVAVTRVDPERREGPPFLPDERLDAETALAAFTLGSAFVNRLDGATGSIRVGTLADLAVLDHDPFGPGNGPIGDARVLLTLVEGRVVHQATP
jgi:predicted amidohydrolase YtcJ